MSNSFKKIADEIEDINQMLEEKLFEHRNLTTLVVSYSAPNRRSKSVMVSCPCERCSSGKF